MIFAAAIEELEQENELGQNDWGKLVTKI